MPLSANAGVLYAKSYIRDVRAAGDFIHQQDPTRADERYEHLLARLTEAKEFLRWNPEAGRPAQLQEAQTVQGAAIAKEVQKLMLEQALPTLRELIVKPYLLLYAHNDKQVLLLGMKHERQLGFKLGSS